MTWEMFRFTSYTASDLEACARRLKDDATSIWHLDDTEAWTEFVLDWFAAAAPDDLLVNARPSRGRWRHKVRRHGLEIPYRRSEGEWMLDLAHSTYSLAGAERYWQRQLEGDLDCTIRLALEVEWGNRNAILDDASKIAAVRGDAKVMITGVPAKLSRDVQRDLERLRVLSKDGAPWLWINLADDWAPTAIEHKLLHESAS